MLLLNLLLALAWLLVTGQFTLGNFVFGFGVTYLLLWVIQRAVWAETPMPQRLTYFQKVRQVGDFLLFFIKELIMANLQVASDVLRRQPRMQPAVVSIPVGDLSDAGVTLLANMITLTPGTLSLDVLEQPGATDTERRRELQIHAMYAGTTKAAILRFRTQLMERYLHRVQEVLES